MTKLNVVLIIINSIIVLALLFREIYKINGEKLSFTKDKLNTSEEECLDKFKTKYDLIMQLIEYTEKKYKIESKAFEDAKEIKIESLDSFKNEKILNKCFKEILQIKEDNTKVKETKAFRELIKQYNENELNIISLRTYHNKYTLVFNDMIKKFPYNIISKIKKYNINELIEGQEISSFNNDLEV